jgi:hypothetical protein
VYNTLAFLGVEKPSPSTRFSNAMHHFREAIDAWMFFVERGVHDWDTLREQLNVFKAKTLIMPPRPGPSNKTSENTMEKLIYPQETGAPSARSTNFNNAGAVDFNAIQPKGEEDSFHGTQPTQLSDFCQDCNIRLEPQCEEACLCQKVTQWIDENNPAIKENLRTANRAAKNVRDEFYFLSGTKAPVQLSNPDTQDCVVCEQAGHFARDCPEQNGCGKSIPGQRFGTADGFKKDDDPAKRHPNWVKFREKTQREYAARTKQPFRKPNSGGSGSGKFGTYARRLKNGKADAPTPQRYQALRQLNILLQAEAENLGLLEDMLSIDEINMMSSFCEECL